MAKLDEVDMNVKNITAIITCAYPIRHVHLLQLNRALLIT